LDVLGAASLDGYNRGMDLPPVDSEAIIRALLERPPAIHAPAPRRCLLSDLWNVVMTTSSETNAWTNEMALLIDDTDKLIDRIRLDARVPTFPSFRV
jgi:hypothetical protein